MSKRRRLLMLILVTSTLVLLAISGHWWLPPLLTFVGINSDLIQGIEALVQLILLVCAAIAWAARLRNHIKLDDALKKRDALRKVLGSISDINEVVTRALHQKLDADWQETQRELYREVNQTRQLFRDDKEVYDALRGLGGIIRIPNTHPDERMIYSDIDKYIRVLENKSSIIEESLST